MSLYFREALEHLPFEGPKEDERSFFHLSRPESGEEPTALRFEPTYYHYSQMPGCNPCKVELSEIPTLDCRTYAPKQGDRQFIADNQHDIRILSTVNSQCKELSAAINRDLSTCKTKGQEATDYDTALRYAKGYRALQRAQAALPTWLYDDQGPKIRDSCLSNVQKDLEKIETAINGSTNLTEKQRSRLCKSVSTAYMAESNKRHKDECHQVVSTQSELIPSWKPEEKSRSKRLKSSIMSFCHGGRSRSTRESAAVEKYNRKLEERVKSYYGSQTETPTSVEGWQNLCKSTTARRTAESRYDSSSSASRSVSSNHVRGYAEPGNSENSESQNFYSAERSQNGHESV